MSGKRAKSIRAGEQVGRPAGEISPAHSHTRHTRSPARAKAALGTQSPAIDPVIKFRAYQLPIFLDRTTGLQILHWSRQIGKSFTLAAWSVDRLLTQLKKYDTWLITVLSNSRDNGAEFVLKCHEVCAKYGIAQRTVAEEKAQGIGDAAVFVSEDTSPDLTFDNMRMEVRITYQGRVGRIKVLAANPRTARGFSGDLILDEFAFHENSAAIWEAAEPILTAHPEYLCRIASTGNGTFNMFYRLQAGASGVATKPNPAGLTRSLSGYVVSRVSRSAAHAQGVVIYDIKTRKPISPDAARAASLDKRAYDQNYELAFNAEEMALLTHELISAAERSFIPIDEQQWSIDTLNRLRMLCAGGDSGAPPISGFYLGNDIGRNRDLSVLTVMAKIGQLKRVVAMLRMERMRLPDQQRQLDLVCALSLFRMFCGDMTGLGLGLVEYAQERWGMYRIRGINFSSSEPITEKILAEGRKAETVRVTEAMATDLLACFEDRSIEIPVDLQLQDDLRKPEKITSATGRVSIAATRDEAGHADHFWSLALGVRAMSLQSGPFEWAPVTLSNREGRRPVSRREGVLV